MKNRFRLIRRGNRSGAFYCVDSKTRKRISLGNIPKSEAVQILEAKNIAERQPMLNLQIAKAYLRGTDSELPQRTWQHVIDALAMIKQGPTKRRWLVAAKDRALVSLLPKVVIETQAEDFLRVLQEGTVSTNVYLRRLHNFALDMNWLFQTIIPKRQWPAVKFKPKRAITLEEHQRIIAREPNAERKAFYELCWHLGGSQLDTAELHAEDIDWKNRTVSYIRKKLRGRINLTPPLVHFGEATAEIFRRLPSKGQLFPYLASVRSGDRATEFKQRCDGLGIKGISLHSYRYAWAERARQAGYPLRFAMEALGHNSKAVHHGYARQAQVKIPSLEEYEAKADGEKIIPFAEKHLHAPQNALAIPYPRSVAT